MHESNKKLTRSRYIWDNNRRALIIAPIVFLLLITFVVLAQHYEWESWPKFFENYLDVIIAIGTFGVAALVWLGEKWENWREAIPKKLNILYLVDDGNTWKEHVIVVQAPLAGESDIRAWGQSIGRTAFPSESENGWGLSFSGFSIGKPVLDRKMKEMNYDLLIFLREEISGNLNGKCFVFDQYGSKWQAVQGTPICHQAVCKRLRAAVPPYIKSARGSEEGADQSETNSDEISPSDPNASDPNSPLPPLNPPTP